MKCVQAIIKPFKLDEVKDYLHDQLGIGGMTVSEVRGFGRQRGMSALHGGTDYQVEFRPKVKLEIYVVDEMVPHVIAALERVARTGRIGDGKILSIHVTHAVRIRDGDRDDVALR